VDERKFRFGSPAAGRDFAPVVAVLTGSGAGQDSYY